MARSEVSRGERRDGEEAAHLAAIAFAIYYVLAFPNDAAKIVRGAALGLEAAAHRLGDFVTSLA